MVESRTNPARHVRGAVATIAVASLAGLSACGGGAPADDAPGDAAGDAASASATRQTSGGEDHSHEGDAGHAHDEGEGHTHDGAASHAHAAGDTLAAGVTLEPGSGAGWTGSATLLGVGDSVRVLLSVRGAPAGSRHRAALVAGSCGDPGAELVSLTPVAAGSSGDGSSQTTLPRARLDGHAHGAIRLAGRDGSAAACAPVHLSASDHGHG